MTRSALLAIVSTVALAALVGCGTSSSSNRGGTSARDTGRPGPATGGAAVHNAVRDGRIILYQPATRTRIVLVNERHARRKTRDGRRYLASGGAGYQVISDASFDAMLETFKNYKARVIEEPWRSGDERYLQAGPNQFERFKGVVVVENDGRRVKHMGLRPQGATDAVGQAKYKVFVDLKSAVVFANNSSPRLERPDSVMQVDRPFGTGN